MKATNWHAPVRARAAKAVAVTFCTSTGQSKEDGEYIEVLFTRFDGKKADVMRLVMSPGDAKDLAKRVLKRGVFEMRLTLRGDGLFLNLLGPNR